MKYKVVRATTSQIRGLIMSKNNLNDSIGFNIARVGILLRRELIHALKEYDITPEQWQILVILYDSDNSINQKEIVDRTYQDRHAMSKMVKKLYEKKLINKISSDTDSRVSLIEITSKGRDVKSKIQANLNEVVKLNSLSKLTSNEKKTILDIMKKIRITLGDKL